MSRLRLGRPIWLAGISRPQRRRYPTLTRRSTVDVAIVGGGLIGATTAWVFASAGLRVAVLEANRVGLGSTAANSGLLMQEPDETFGRLSERYGVGAAERIWRLSRMATRRFIELLDTLDIDCDLGQRESFYYSLTPGGAKQLASEHRRRHRRGLGGRWIDATALDRATGISGGGAIRTLGNAQLDPYRACLGLMQKAAEIGVGVFESSPVQRIDSMGTGVCVVTPRGAVCARHVVIATGYATKEFRPLAARFMMRHTYVLVTEPIDRDVVTRLGSTRPLLWDTERPYHYARWTSDHRLLLGGADRALVSETRRPSAFAAGRQQLIQYFVARFPSLADIRIEYAWEGLFALTPDGLPYIGPHRQYPAHLFALGYGGNGMTFGFLAATLLLDRLGGAWSPDHELFAFNRSSSRARH